MKIHKKKKRFVSTTLWSHPGSLAKYIPLIALALLLMIPSGSDAYDESSAPLPPACTTLTTAKDIEICSTHLALHIMQEVMNSRVIVDNFPVATQDKIYSGADNIFQNSPENCSMLLPDLRNIFVTVPENTPITSGMVSQVVPIYDRAESCGDRLIALFQNHDSDQLIRRAKHVKYMVTTTRDRIQNSL